MKKTIELDIPKDAAERVARQDAWDGWKCCNCGAVSPRRARSCDCPTNVLYREEGNYLAHQVKIDPEDRAHKVMTPEEYQNTPIKGWHMVCRDYDTNYGVGVRYIADGLLQEAPALPARPLSEAIERARSGRWVEDCAETFVNEHGRQITIQVFEQGWNVRVAIIGPDSTFESIVTPNEAIALQRMLSAALASRLARPAKAAPEIVEQAADAIDAARYHHPEHPRERPRPFGEADKSDREYATRLARAALTAGETDGGDRG